MVGSSADTDVEELVARAAASLHHGNIVPVYSVGSDHGVHFYAMQLIEGQTVAQLVCQTIQEHTPLGPAAKHADASQSSGSLLRKTALSDSEDATIVFPDGAADVRPSVLANVDTDAVAQVNSAIPRGCRTESTTFPV